MIDATQIMPPPQEGDHRPPPPMVRLHNLQTGVQVHVAERQANRLLAQGYQKGALPTPAAKKPDTKADNKTPAASAERV